MGEKRRKIHNTFELAVKLNNHNIRAGRHPCIKGLYFLFQEEGYTFYSNDTYREGVVSFPDSFMEYWSRDEKGTFHYTNHSRLPFRIKARLRSEVENNRFVSDMKSKVVVQADYSEAERRAAGIGGKE